MTFRDTGHCDGGCRRMRWNRQSCQDGDQLSRQWRLVRLLSGKLGRSLAQLRAELGVTKRTVLRDIEGLERAGFPIVSEARDGTIFLRSGRNAGVCPKVFDGSS